MDYTIGTIKNYPDDGKHMECFNNTPFEIRKGEDAYEYTIKGVKKTYNYRNSSDKIDERWIVNLKTEKASLSLKKIFEIKLHKDLDKILKYCDKLYQTSLKLELKNIK